MENFEEMTTIEENIDDVEEETSHGAGLVIGGLLAAGAAVFGGVKLVKHLKAKKAAKKAESDASESNDQDTSDSKKDSKKK